MDLAQNTTAVSESLHRLVISTAFCSETRYTCVSQVKNLVEGRNQYQLVKNLSTLLRQVHQANISFELGVRHRGTDAT